MSITFIRGDTRANGKQPSFTGLMAAYFMGADESDHYNVTPPRVQPGDMILHARRTL